MLVFSTMTIYSCIKARWCKCLVSCNIHWAYPAFCQRNEIANESNLPFVWALFAMIYSLFHCYGWCRLYPLSLQVRWPLDAIQRSYGAEWKIMLLSHTLITWGNHVASLVKLQWFKCLSADSMMVGQTEALTISPLLKYGDNYPWCFNNFLTS